MSSVDDPLECVVHHFEYDVLVAVSVVVDVEAVPPFAVVTADRDDDT